MLRRHSESHQHREYHKKNFHKEKIFSREAGESQFRQRRVYAAICIVEKKIPAENPLYSVKQTCKRTSTSSSGYKDFKRFRSRIIRTGLCSDHFKFVMFSWLPYDVYRASRKLLVYSRPQKAILCIP